MIPWLEISSRRRKSVYISETTPTISATNCKRMKTTSILIAAVAITTQGICFASLPVSRVSTVVSIPVTPGVAKMISIPVQRTVTARARVGSVSGDNVTLSVPLPGAITSAHVALIVTGVHRGKFFDLNIGSSTASVLNLTGLSTSGISLDSSDRLDLIENWTLRSLFQNSNAFASALSGSACQVAVYNGGSAVFYWLQSGASGGWKTVSGNIASDTVVIPFGSSIKIIQRGGRTTINLTGLQPSGRQAVFGASVGGTFYVSNPFFRDITTGTIKAQLTPSALSGTAERLILDNAGSFVTYWRRTSDGALVNLATNAVLPDTTVIPAGTGFGVVKRSATPSNRFVTFEEPFAP